MKQILFTFVTYWLLLDISNGESDWGYLADNGPNTWSQNYTLCGSSNQSPIAIQHNTAVVNNSLGSFKHALFDVPPVLMLIKNTEHSLQIDLTGAYTIDDPTLLSGKFKAVQFHFHWAAPNTNGSEHTLDGTQYWGELHIVHYNEKYNSFSEASSQPDGLAVLGFFIMDDNQQDNVAVNRVIEPLESFAVSYYMQSVTYNLTFTLETLLPSNISVYYRYKGSLTTPTCDESVVWTVFREPIRISRRQAGLFETRVFVNEQGQSPNVSLYANFRPTQSLNERNVTRSAVTGEASFVRASFHWITLFAMIVYTLSLF